MLFSKRLKLSNKVVDWFDKVDEKFKTVKVVRDITGVITALDALGYLKENPLEKESDNWAIFGPIKINTETGEKA